MSVTVNHRNIACLDCHEKISNHEVGDFRICIYPGTRASFCRIKRELANDRPNVGGTETVETKDLPVDLNDMQTEACILEFVCEDCMDKRQEIDEKQFAQVMQNVHKMLHPEIRSLWRQYAPSQQKLPWERGALIRQLVRHGTPYLLGLTVIDGRETDFCRDSDRPGLVDPSVLCLTGGLPASYRMFVQKERVGAMDLLMRYLRLTDFINCIFVYRLTGVHMDGFTRAIEKCITELVEEYHIQIADYDQDNKSALIAVVRQTPSNNTQDLLDQVETGRVSAHLVPEHMQRISECLMKFCQTLDVVQPPTPISSTEFESDSLAINVNCHRVGNKGLYGFTQTFPFKVFYIRPRNPDHPPKQALFVPMRFQEEHHAATAHGSNTDYELRISSMNQGKPPRVPNHALQVQKNNDKNSKENANRPPNIKFHSPL